MSISEDRIAAHTIHPKLKHEVKKQWLEDLRSGLYTQVNGALRKIIDYKNTYYGHCCLGVLCDKQKDGCWRTNENDCYKKIYFSYKSFSSEKYLPYPLIKDLFTTEGILYTDIVIEVKDIVDHLINMNDRDKKNFNEIANWIEENL